MDNCSQCEHEISPTAEICPGCGHSVAMCPHCQSRNVSRYHGLYGITEGAVALLLSFMYLIPGVAYFLYMQTIPFCPDCRRRVWKFAPRKAPKPSRGKAADHPDSILGENATPINMEGMGSWNPITGANAFGPGEGLNPAEFKRSEDGDLEQDGSSPSTGK